MKRRRLLQLLGKSLAAAGDFDTTLDFPCGTGSHWPVLRRAGVAKLIAAEFSKGMLDVASANRTDSIFPDELMLTSAFQLDLGDQSVDFVACLDFFNLLDNTRLDTNESRLKLLSELQRVSRKYVALSVTSHEGMTQLFVDSGFEVVSRYDLWPLFSSWQLCLLKRIS